MALKARILRGVLAPICLLAGTEIAMAQITTGSIAGTIKDAQGGVIPGATVILISESQNTQSAPVVTNETGDFVFVNVKSDTYSLEVTMPSFKTIRKTGVRVGAAERVSVGTMAIEPGGVAETVEDRRNVIVELRARQRRRRRDGLVAASLSERTPCRENRIAPVEQLRGERAQLLANRIRRNHDRGANRVTRGGRAARR